MLARSDGRIINVASQLGIKGASSLSHYAAAKAGVGEGDIQAARIVARKARENLPFHPPWQIGAGGRNSDKEVRKTDV